MCCLGQKDTISYLGCRSELGCMRCAVEMRLFLGPEAGGSAATFSAVRSLPVFGHHLETPLEIQAPAEACLLLGQGTTASIPAVCSSSLAGAVGACRYHQERFAQPRVDVPSMGTRGPQFILGSHVSFLLGPGIPDVCIHLGVAEGQINLSVQCSSLEVYLLFHIFSSDHL